MLEFWYDALQSENGVKLHSPDPDRLRAKLYAARKAACDEALEGISVVIPPFPNQVWLVKNAPQGRPAPGKGDGSAL